MVRLTSPATLVDSIDREIESTGRISEAARWVHASVVGPFGRRYSSQKLKCAIMEYVRKGDHFLDVACGDDLFIFEVATRAGLCVGNDVQWIQVKRLIEHNASQSPKNMNVSFTNHDACDLPFKKQFDLTLCKNLLHHMKSKPQLIQLLQSLRSVSRRVLIVDPENPDSGTRRARLWRQYYVKLLKDQGDKFFTCDEFQRVLREFFGSNCEFRTVKTIKGNYLFCHAYTQMPEITLRDDKEHATPIKAVIFDLDGLIVDTESVFYAAMHDELLELGIELSREEYVRKDLQNGTSVLEELEASGRISSLREVQRAIYGRYFELLKVEVREMPGAIECVKSLSMSYTLAIASSSKLEFIEFVLKRLGLRKYFEVIVSRESTKNLKPEPDCLLMVLNQLKLKAQQCVLIEDSLRGLRAAQAIGMHCILVPNKLTRGYDYADADLVAESLVEVTRELIQIPGKK